MSALNQPFAEDLQALFEALGVLSETPVSSEPAVPVEQAATPCADAAPTQSRQATRKSVMFSSLSWAPVVPPTVEPVQLVEPVEIPDQCLPPARPEGLCPDEPALTLPIRGDSPVIAELPISEAPVTGFAPTTEAPDVSRVPARAGFEATAKSEVAAEREPDGGERPKEPEAELSEIQTFAPEQKAREQQTAPVILDRPVPSGANRPKTESARDEQRVATNPPAATDPRPRATHQPEVPVRSAPAAKEPNEPNSALNFWSAPVEPAPGAEQQPEGVPPVRLVQASTGSESAAPAPTLLRSDKEVQTRQTGAAVPDVIAAPTTQRVAMPETHRDPVPPVFAAPTEEPQPEPPQATDQPRARTFDLAETVRVSGASPSAPRQQFAAAVEGETEPRAQQRPAPERSAPEQPATTTAVRGETAVSGVIRPQRPRETTASSQPNAPVHMFTAAQRQAEAAPTADAPRTPDAPAPGAMERAMEAARATEARTPAQSISVHLDGPEPVDLRFVHRNGETQMQVRSDSPDMTQRLRADLPELQQSLGNRGFQFEADTRERHSQHREYQPDEQRRQRQPRQEEQGDLDG